MNLSVEKRVCPIVLVADDDPTTRLIATEVLTQAGMEVVEACDGVEAIELFDQVSPDLVLLDVDMPRCDGFSVCQALRCSEHGSHVPVCIISGLDDFESADKAYYQGATDFISKPIDWSVLPYRVRYLLRSSNALNEIRGLMAALPDKIFVLDEEGGLYDRPAGFDDQVLQGAESLTSTTFEDLFGTGVHPRVKQAVNAALTTSTPQILEHRYDRENIYLETRFVARDRHSVLAIVRDITQRKKTETQVFNLAYYDRLTGLPNRHLFSEELNDVIRVAHKTNRTFTMMFVDLDNFKRINDTLGHSIGDELLKAVARRLESCTRSEDGVVRFDQDLVDGIRLARLGGDEFVLMLNGVSDNATASSIADRVIATLSSPFNCKGYQLVVTPSIGIAFYPRDGESRDELLMNADMAMYQAKEAGRNTHRFYSGTSRKRSLHRLSLEEEIRNALERQDFELYYQPKVDVSNWSIVGAEALIRWRHSERGWISPSEFIPVAEETGLILKLGSWVLQEACAQIRCWQQSPLEKLTVSVNVSSQQIYSEDLMTVVCNTVSAAGIPPNRLELEITESMLMRDVESTIQTLNELKKFGVGLSIDDFGTGYSSLSYLKRFPIDALKIDSSFVRDLQRDNDDAAICAAILAMAHKLDLKVVAEGVELATQANYLRAQQCDQIQGYYFSKPLPADAFKDFFLSNELSGATGTAV